MYQPFCPEVILTYSQIARGASHSPWRSSWTPWSSASWSGKYSPQLWFKTITSLRLNVSLRSDQYPNVSFNLSISWCRISCSNVQSLSFLRSIKANICIRDLIDQTRYIFYAENTEPPLEKAKTMRNNKAVDGSQSPSAMLHQAVECWDGWPSPPTQDVPPPITWCNVGIVGWDQPRMQPSLSLCVISTHIYYCPNLPTLF